MNEKTELMGWAKKFASKYCYKCEDNCCNGTRQLINLRPNEKASLELFSSNGIPIYNLDEIDRRSLNGWLINGCLNGLFSNSPDNFIGDVKFRDGTVIEKPAILESPSLGECSADIITGEPKINIIEERRIFVLYVEKYCPFYVEKEGCKVYDHPDRPSTCREYPVNLSTQRGFLEARIQTTCPFRQEAYKELKEQFPDLPVEVR